MLATTTVMRDGATENSQVVTAMHACMHALTWPTPACKSFIALLPELAPSLQVADSPPSKNMPRNSSLGHLASLRNMGTGRFVSPSVQSALVILPDYRWWAKRPSGYCMGCSTWVAVWRG